MKNIVLIFLIGVFVMSCGSRKNLGTDRTRTIKDSVRISTQYQVKDTIVTIPADSATLRALFSELSETPITQKNGNITASLSRQGDHVIANCNTEAQDIEIEYLNKIIEIQRERETRDKETIRIPVKYIPKVIKTLAWIGGIVIALFIVSIILKFKKII